MTTAEFARPLLLRTAPISVVEFVTSVLGGGIARETPAAAGFTPSVASVVSAASGRHVFVKAGAVGDAGGDAVRVGAELASTIGDLGPPLLSWSESDGWVVAVYERVHGAAIAEWNHADLGSLAALSHHLRERLDPSPVRATEPYAHAFAPLLGAWEALQRPATAATASVAHVRHLDLPYGLRVETLAELEAEWFETLASGTAFQHGDIRRDNVMREPSGRLRLVDWTHRWTAPGWADWIRLIPDIAADGFDPEAVLAASAWSDADPHGVDVMLAGLAGRCWRDGHAPAVPGLPQLRPMQLLQGDMTLRWLARRL
ncbi:aminoglycoside phosphotransferase family protein [Agromyces cerinus]|uniref:Phosphotransferase enzyme family protein n=1 Tax=Agromyces cerinus subsp. cerinus TaxID=232089 RepID=A0A1N6E4K1_9MICO|nr:hypothetical protein [Agromyces cerinus]SIN77985.1 hypothetical protein SAMN05443544_1081 [Agromyces cerinus subsp. cerinus]